MLFRSPESWLQQSIRNQKKLSKHDSILRVPLCTCTPTSTGVNIKLFACTFQNRQFQNHKRQFQNFYFRIRCSDIQDLEYGMPLMDSFRFVWQTFTLHQQSFCIFTGANPWICRALGSEMFAFQSTAILHHRANLQNRPKMWNAQQ